MKVLFVSAGDYKYGAPKSMLELMLELREKYGITPILLTKKHNQINKICDDKNIENYSFWYSDIMAGAPYKSKILKLAKHIVKYLLFCLGKVTEHKKSEIPFDEIDLIHTNLNRIGIGAYFSKKYNIPHIWHLRELGKEDYNVVLYKKNCIRYMNDNANAFIAISNAVKKAWVEKGINEKKIDVIYNFLDLSQFQKRDIKTTDVLKIVMTGHIQPNKGQIQLVKAMRYIPESIKQHIKIDFYGEGYREYTEEIEREIKKLNCENIVTFKGYSKDIPKLLCQYDIGVVASKAEGFGRVTVEYMAAGLLVIASNTGANEEIIKDGVTGLIYKYNNIRNLADKIIWAFHNQKKMNEISVRGNQYVYDNFSKNSNIAEMVYAKYKSVIEKVGEKNK